LLLQANELDLAIDVYRQLLREGCTPNLVTYNILIDVHGKTGNWAEAVKVLDALESQVGIAVQYMTPSGFYFLIFLLIFFLLLNFFLIFLSWVFHKL